MPRSKPTPKRLRWDAMPCRHPQAAGMDIGASAIGVAVPPDRAAEPWRVLEPLPPELPALVAWLVACPMDTGALASTGLSGVPRVERLAQHAITPSLVQARPGKPGPGRTTDWNDAPWLPKLPTLGCWHAACRPDAERCLWRTLLRHRAGVSAPRAPPSLPRHQALNRMHIPRSAVRTEITGVTGQASLRALVQGARDPLTRAP